MGNYSKLLFISAPLKRIVLNPQKLETKLVFEWLETYKGITFQNELAKGVSLAKVIEELDGHKIFGYMDEQMMMFFINLVEAIDWKDSEREANSKYYAVFSEEGWNNHHFLEFCPQGIREHIYQPKAMNQKQTKLFVKTHLQNTDTLIWMKMENSALRAKINHKMLVQSGLPIGLFG